MPKGSNPAVFVSSTCFDLSQIRRDIRNFLIDIGLEPILSDFDSFPVNPDQNTLSNCLDNVKNRSDIYVLIIGDRYGSLNEAGKSITNLEFYEAKLKGIPKYIFIKQEILSYLRLWKSNPSADFSSVVDNPSLFEFVDELHSSGELWVFPFSNAQDIISCLKKQLSYLFAECLDLRAKIKSNDPLIGSLKTNALQLVVEKPLGWEYLLFSQVLADEINHYRDMKFDVELGIFFGEPAVIDNPQDLISWITSLFDTTSYAVSQLEKVINNGFQVALGKPGEPSDIERMLHLVKRIGNIYKQLLDIHLQFKRVMCSEEFNEILKLGSEFPLSAAIDLEEFSLCLFSTFEERISTIDSNDAQGPISIKLTLRAVDAAAYESELLRLKSVFGYD